MMSLEDRLQKKIETTGPMSVADFMTIALYDPQDGYYTTKIPIGAKGDYITAPEMTQVFGEVIAGWLINVWHQAGSPTPFHIVEIGPGRGTLMLDIIRTMQSLKVPVSEMTVHLVEVSPLLKDLQKTILSAYSASISWHEDLSTLPHTQGFCLMVANEFWDALPIRQYVKINEEWVERYVSFENNRLCFIPTGSTIVKEVCPAMPEWVSKIAMHMKKNKGTALFLDYGYKQLDATGDTLQALQNHQRQSPLINVGKSDLTHHVDFFRLSLLFKEAGLTVQEPISQGDFLTAMGLEMRTEYLCKNATPETRGSLRTAAVRLTHPSQMGKLFKALTVASN